MMYRNQFKKVADAIHRVLDYEEYDVATLHRVARELAVVFQVENPRFDRNRFLRACGLDPS